MTDVTKGRWEAMRGEFVNAVLGCFLDEGPLCISLQILGIERKASGIWEEVDAV